MTHNSQNMLTAVVTSEGAISYEYDAENYRISKTEYGKATSYVVNPNGGLSQVLMSTTNGETTYYIYGLGLIAQENADGYITHHYDYRGSTTAITDTNGNVTDRIYYDAYGNIIQRTGETKTPFNYVGKYGVETDDNGLYYMRARYYNPQIQRFVNVDPIRDELNWYGYCGGNCINYVDYKGLSIWDKIKGLIDATDKNFYFGSINLLASIVSDNSCVPESEYDYYEGRVAGDVISEIASCGITVTGIGLIAESFFIGGGITIGSGGTLSFVGGAITVTGVIKGSAIATYGGTVFAISGKNFNADYSKMNDLGKSEYKRPKSGSGKEKATDVPSWARQTGERPYKGESGKDFAKRLCDEHFGVGNYDTKGNSDFKKIQKWGDRGFE